MYSHTGRNKQCERKTNTCLYSFPMKNLNTSQTGTYYCAVAACGHILFGDGTKPDINNGYLNLYILSGALAFTTILASFMAVLLCNIYKSQSGRSGGKSFCELKVNKTQ
ncbi:hypothetical protein D4764_03G0003080 [Takifugu flavidus]|uniref:Ig-like domain-containing protein n=1 Tax=Takifugu flavidus TaxID=433684 RepID=A0A5C6NBN1_9TELE|nr:hypothetical protein D4764_03G0003080 [Takifugu flavidus]